MKADQGLDRSGVDHLLGFQLALATARTREVFMREIGTPLELRTVEFTLLVLLLTNGGASPKQLARSLAMPAPNVTALIDRGVARGLVERRRNSTDRRALQILLTAAGKALARRAHAASLTMEDALLQRFSPGERTLLRELLLRLAQGAPA
jgi:DNA-binding MarR family transcriptional regulator